MKFGGNYRNLELHPKVQCYQQETHKSRARAHCNKFGTPWLAASPNLRNSNVVEDNCEIFRENTHTLTRDWINNVNEPAFALPVYEHGVLYFGTALGGAFALSEDDGNIIWRVSLPDPNSHAVEVSALLHGKYVFFCTGTQLHKLLKSDGTIVWSSSILESYGYSGEVLGTPVLAKDKIICGVSGLDEEKFPFLFFRGRIVAFDEDTGSLIWIHYNTSDQTVPNPQFSRGSGSFSAAAVDLKRNMLFIGTSQGRTFTPPPSPQSDSLLALNLSNGNLIWSYQFQTNDAFTLFPPTPNPAIPGTYDHDVGQHPNLFRINGKDYVGVGCKNGHYAIFKRVQKTVTGKPLVDIILGPGGSQSGPLEGAAVVHKGVLYITANSAIVKGQLVSGDFITSPFVPFPFPNPNIVAEHANVRIYALSIAKLLEAGNANGTIPPQAVLWIKNNYGYCYGVITYVNQVIFYTDAFTGVVHARSAKSGKLLWKREVYKIDTSKSLPPQPFGIVPAAITGGVTVADKRIFVPFSGISGFFTNLEGGIATYKIDDIVKQCDKSNKENQKKNESSPVNLCF